MHTRPNEPKPIVIGSKSKRNYHDAVGKPLAPGDIIVYATAHSSSVSMNFSVISEIVDLDEPVVIRHWYPGANNPRPALHSWDLAFKLKVKTLTQDAEVPDVLFVPQKWDRTAGAYIPQPLDAVKPNTIHKVERVVKIEGVEVHDGPRP